MLLRRFAETTDDKGRKIRFVIECDIELHKDTMEYVIKIPSQTLKETVEFAMSEPSIK